ncbi:hypothetical protein PIROE2DRAFT_9781, partial [Piromyces sp. E2]
MHTNCDVNVSSNSIAEYVIAIRNYDNYDNYILLCSSPYKYFANHGITINKQQVLTKRDLYEISKKNSPFKVYEKNSNPVVLNNKVVISALIYSTCFTENLFKNYMNYRLDIKNFIYDDNVKDNTIKWKIENFNELEEESMYCAIKSLILQWNVMLLKNKSKDYITIRISSKCNDIKFSKYGMFFVAIQNYDNPSIFYEKFNTKNFVSFNPVTKYYDFIFEKKHLFDKNNKFKKPIIENNRLIIHVLARSYSSNIRNYVVSTLDDFLCEYQGDTEEPVNSKGYVEFNLGSWPNFKKLKYSYFFNYLHTQWEIDLFPKGSIEYPNSISVFLRNKNNENYHFFMDYAVCIFKKFTETKEKGDYEETITYEYLKYLGFNEFDDLNSNYDKYSNWSFHIGILLYTYKMKKSQIKEINEFNNVKMVGKPIYFEWRINDWKNIKNSSESKEFEMKDIKWKFKIDKDENNDKTSLYVKCTSVENNFKNVFSRYNLIIRHKSDFSYYKLKIIPSLVHYSKDNLYYGIDDFIKISEINNIEDGGFFFSENNQIIVGIYISIFDVDKREPSYIEFPISNWNELNEKEYQMDFNYNNYKWNFLLYPTGYKNDKNISIYLKNEDIEQNICNRICAKAVLIIRNKNDYSNFIIKELPIKYIKKNFNRYGEENIVNTTDAIENLLIENDKTVIGRHYNNINIILNINFINIHHISNLECFKDELKELLLKYDNCNDSSLLEEKFIEYKVNDWFNIKDCIQSEIYNIGGFNWNLSLYPHVNNESKFISLYLNNTDFKNGNISENNNVYASYIFAIHNYYDPTIFQTKSSKFIQHFNNKNPKLGFNKFFEKKYLNNNDDDDNDENNIKSYVHDNKIFISAYIRVYDNSIFDDFFNVLKSEIENNTDKTIPTIDENYFEYNIKNFNKNNIFYYFNGNSCGFDWGINLKSNENGYLSFFVTCLNFENENFNNFEITSIKAKLVLFIRNNNEKQFNMFSKASPFKIFNKKTCTYVDEEFIKISDLYLKNEETNSCFIDKDELVVGVYISLYEINKF